MQALGADNLEQLDIALRVSGQLNTMTDSTACEANSFCANSIQTFKSAVKLFNGYVTNVTLAGVSFSSMGQPDGHNTSWVRINKGFYRHVCVVHTDDRQWVCMNSCNAVTKGSCCPQNSCGLCDRCFGTCCMHS